MRAPVRCPSASDRPALPPRPRSGAPRLGSPRPQFTRWVCLPAAKMKLAGGEWIAARKEMEPHVLAVGRALTETQPSLRSQL